MRLEYTILYIENVLETLSFYQQTDHMNASPQAYGIAGSTQLRHKTSNAVVVMARSFRLDTRRVLVSSR